MFVYHLSYTVATRTDYFVERTEFACLFFRISSDEVVACQPKDAHQNLV